MLTNMLKLSDKSYQPYIQSMNVWYKVKIAHFFFIYLWSVL